MIRKHRKEGGVSATPAAGLKPGPPALIPQPAPAGTPTLGACNAGILRQAQNDVEGRALMILIHRIRRGALATPENHAAGEMEQIQFLPGHVSVQTTERSLGCKQRLREAVNDRIGIEL